MRIFITAALAVTLYGQPAGFNYDESKAGDYKLPDPLVLSTGERVKDKSGWEKRRRPEILRMFEKEMFGRSPGKPQSLAFELKSIDKAALGGKAVRKEVTVLFNGKPDGPKMDMLLYLPAKASRRVPVFLGLNFNGNHTVTSEPGITVTKSWMRSNKLAERGSDSRSWPVERIIDRGYGVATIYYGDIDRTSMMVSRTAFMPCMASQVRTSGAPSEPGHGDSAARSTIWKRTETWTRSA